MKKIKNAKKYLVRWRERNCSPRRIVALRWNRLHLSQTLFAKIMGVSKQTVNSWESGWRVPSEMARRFLYLLWENPAMVDKLVFPKGGSND